VVSLLVVLAIVGVVAGGVNARDQAQQLRQKARDDVAKALEQGAQNNARSEEASQ
jgi:hypothetical protein